MDKKIENLLGLAQRAGKLVTGEDGCKKAVQSQKALLVLVAEDASENTQKRFQDKTAFYQVPLRVYGTKESLGKAIGKETRTIVAVTDRGLANKMMEYMEMD